MADYAVRHDRAWHRYVTACACGRTVNLPEDGLATHVCRCGLVWKSNGAELSMWTPKRWNEGGERN